MMLLHSFYFRKTNRLAGFTLIELLTVIVIIAILAALTLAAASGVMKLAARDRAKTEIKAMSAALESYKIDNGAFPLFDFGTTYSAVSSSTPGSIYQQSAQVLYLSLSGQTYYTTTTGAKSYMTFKTTQLGNYTAGGNATYVQDPFGNAYGYASTNSTVPTLPYNGQGFFDLWSTAGDPTETNLIGNWGN